MSIAWDIVALLIAALAANVLFNGYERHLPMWRRAAKLALVAIVLGTIGAFAGRIVFWSIIAVLTAGQLFLHLWWFPARGVHWRTAEPRETYLALIAEMKRRRRPSA